MTDNPIPVLETPGDVLRAFIYHQAETRHDVYVRLDTSLSWTRGPAYQILCFHCPGWHKTVMHWQLVDLFGFEPTNMVDTLREAMDEMARRLPSGSPTAWAHILKGVV